MVRWRDREAIRVLRLWRAVVLLAATNTSKKVVLKTDREQWYGKVALDAQAAATAGDSRTLFSCICLIAHCC